MIAQIKVGLIIVALVGAAGGVYYVKQLKHNNEVLKLNQAKLEILEPTTPKTSRKTRHK